MSVGDATAMERYRPMHGLERARSRWRRRLFSPASRSTCSRSRCSQPSFSLCAGSRTHCGESERGASSCVRKCRVLFHEFGIRAGPFSVARIAVGAVALAAVTLMAFIGVTMLLPARGLSSPPRDVALAVASPATAGRPADGGSLSREWQPAEPAAARTPFWIGKQTTCRTGWRIGRRATCRRLRHRSPRPRRRPRP